MGYIEIVMPKHHPREYALQANGMRLDVMLRNMEARGVKHNEKEIQTIRAYLKRNASSD